MEKLSIRLNDLSPLINLLIEKIQQLDSDILTKQQKLACSKEMLDVVDNLRMYFVKTNNFENNEHMKIFVEKIERAFSQFEWNTSVAVSPLEFNKFSENAKLLISTLLKLLGTKGCGILIIETYLKLCLKTISEMIEKAENKSVSVDKSNFKLLLEGFSSTANMLKKYWHIVFSPNQKNTIMLCLHQICKVLPYLLKMIEFQNADLKKFSLNLLTKCLTRMLYEIHNDKKSNCQGQEFIMIMDFCLYKLNELSNFESDLDNFIEKANDTVAALKPLIDELLSSVMSIAHVTNFEDDYSAILASSQKVLREFSELINEIKEENSYKIKLNACCVAESLCSLEQKVNIAVLKLVLEVFSSVNSPLKNILNKCRKDITKDNRASEDLKVLISDFDSEMDRIMQICFFAISCTKSLNRILKIQSCLASLEFLEAELIPSLTALYINCSPRNKSNFQCLFDFWLNEITELKILIDSVLDPAGFCGVVKNQIKSLQLAFIEGSSSSNFCLNKLQHNLKQMIRYSRKLIRTLKTSLKDEKEMIKTTEDYIARFHLAVQECEEVLNLMNGGQEKNKTINQAVKRYDFLMHTLDKLSSHLFFLASDEEMKNDEKESTSGQSIFVKLQVPQKDYYKLFDSSDITVTTSNAVPEILTPYMNKGIVRSRKRNVLYSTSLQTSENEDHFNKTLPQTRLWDRTPISSKRSRCCKPLTLNLELENTLDLEITTILENMSRLSNTFSKTSHANAEVQFKAEIEKKEQQNRREVACGVEKSSDVDQPTYTSTGCCAKLEHNANGEEEEDSEEKKLLGFKLRNRFLKTLNDLSHTDSLLVENDSDSPSCVESFDRINDLKIVEEKINFLKTRMPFGLL